MAGKREEYLSWNEYFMGIAILASGRSKDPKNRVGACIVNDDNKILSIGYNGLTLGMSDDEFDWMSSGEKTGIKKYIKDYYIVHAERNAILNFKGNFEELKGSTLYVTWFPCTECTKEIIQVGIKVIKYNNEKNFEKDEISNITDNMLYTLKRLS